MKKSRVALAFFLLALFVHSTTLSQSDYALPGLPLGRDELRDFFSEPSNNVDRVFYSAHGTSETSELGKWLFFRADLGINRGVSCASCHDPGQLWTDGLSRHPLSASARNTPSLIGVGSRTWINWDGSGTSVASQSFRALVNEIGATRASLSDFVLRNEHELVRFFSVGSLSQNLPDINAVVGPAGRDAGDVPLTCGFDTPADRLGLTFANALANYVVTIVPPRTLFDEWIDSLGHSDGRVDLRADQARGLHVFVRQGCVNCHWGRHLTDEAFHRIGVPTVGGGELPDVGRVHGLEMLLNPECSIDMLPGLTAAEAERSALLSFVTGTRLDYGAFRTPSLRGVAATSPYMHNGVFQDLFEVATFYNERLGSTSSEFQIVPDHLESNLQAVPLMTDDEIRSLVAFLKIL